MNSGWATRALLLAGVLALAAFPFVGDEFYVELVVRMMILGIFAMSLDLLIGFTGLVSFGHAAFFGLSAYVLALITPDSGPVSIWWALPLCLLVTSAAALVVGWFSVRTSGIYFIMITLAFAQMLFYFFNQNADLGGSDGLFIFFKPEVAVGSTVLLDLSDQHTFYWFVLGGLVASYLLLAVMLEAPFGRVVRGIKVNESRTRALGYATQRYKLVSFILAAAVAGFAGFLEATHTSFVNPAHLSWHESGLAMMFVILGGMGTLYGPVIGSFAFGLMQDQFQELTEHWSLVIGIFVILIVLFLPQGIAGLVKRVAGTGAARALPPPPSAETGDEAPK
ncbi:MAG: branched-chain amino acid ABC transporter permease [Hyphomicrobiales bacterium]|nr:branched-chain amino acid ABC transporter permease [Hyphomicrobiales bacterium]